ncbi:MAG: hypothetical protein Harvfovirus14_6 [Harvfovirus sp.]|uniref:Uncharacterized protein n=1 Tax=Harvfovirus sp. TaxID=2487768 RepID=A0A3G5A1E9_9VIRU|nr:MAG: hypothetical protein Harvfovirus14_6 [Harvfovirus sp.]
MSENYQQLDPRLTLQENVKQYFNSCKLFYGNVVLLNLCIFIYLSVAISSAISYYLILRDNSDSHDARSFELFGIADLIIWLMMMGIFFLVNNSKEKVDYYYSEIQIRLNDLQISDDINRKKLVCRYQTLIWITLLRSSLLIFYRVALHDTVNDHKAAGASFEITSRVGPLLFFTIVANLHVFRLACCMRPQNSPEEIDKEMTETLNALNVRSGEHTLLLAPIAIAIPIE